MADGHLWLLFQVVTEKVCNEANEAFVNVVQRRVRNFEETRRAHFGTILTCEITLQKPIKRRKQPVISQDRADEREYRDAGNYGSKLRPEQSPVGCILKHDKWSKVDIANTGTDHIKLCKPCAKKAHSDVCLVAQPELSAQLGHNTMGEASWLRSLWANLDKEKISQPVNTLEVKHT